MLLIMVLSALGGWLIYTSYLKGIGEAGLSITALTWSRCVGASALLYAVSATLLVQLFYSDLSSLMALPIWLIFILALDPGYRSAKSKGYPEDDQGEEVADSKEK